MYPSFPSRLQLIAAGLTARDQLVPLIHSKDPEVRIRAREILKHVSQNDPVRRAAELRLNDRLVQVKIDTSLRMWAGMLHNENVGAVTETIVGDYTLHPPRLRILARFKTGETASTLSFLPNGQGVLCGNRDGTVTWYGPRVGAAGDLNDRAPL